ncbi:bifunctional diguanylate cyclase/phosphodiesterase [Marinomonas mediterranea]|jgi:diguanylate cyclase (GGDEF) domain|uniref:Diguanylate cyclase/phosphodiesterase n=1 Tax=Marinomonas mediterranea (strain ATCC 700492 / JCM 21426 / NBRC 103028 / MMB-1) TaxID=717774 RepID=F2JWI2_MARM1|nr:EAL domain-containing protein [Marinomonas mediterranea]ADZ90655.1 diguanylate cyclase/phosphodiesterase [Marinomonas mediterranea MMB-1]WCN16825.1 EAL domain-containing protein [Marinomonas mediterranea MMB-1]
MVETMFKSAKERLIAFFVFLAVLAAGLYITKLSNENFLSSQRLLLSGIARSKASDIERQISHSFTSARILAYEVKRVGGVLPDFEDFAANISQSVGGITSLNLSPNGVIEQVYPRKGNEVALGINVLEHPKYREASSHAIATKSMITVGPVTLRQGGIAVIGRYPIFIEGQNGNDSFWGFSSALVKLDSLFKGSGFDKLEEEGYCFRLTREHKDTGASLEFYHSAANLEHDVITTSEIKLPSATWALTISHSAKQGILSRTIGGAVISFLVAIALAIALYLILLQPRRLKKQVVDKTKELQELAYGDPLTGLPNRRYLNEQVPLLIQNIIKYKRFGAFIYFDLDNFKSINDSIGHDVGDEVLSQVAIRLQKVMGDADKVLRLGGDEFGILLGDAGCELHVIQMADSILEVIQHTLKVGDREFRLSTSLGIVFIPLHGSNILNLMQNADVAMYQAKRKGKNRYEVFAENLRQATVELNQGRISLERAIRESEIELYYQPQFDLQSGMIVSAEVLVRWNHPKRGLLFPDRFIPMAEETGLIVALGNYVIEKTFEYQAKRIAQGLPVMRLHVNVSPLHVNDPHLLDFIKKMVHIYQVPGNLIGLEITETVLVEDLDRVVEILCAIKALGVCISIDDFGTGFSSLGQLKNLPIDILKIDRCFVKDIERDQNDRMIVEAIIAMAHKLKMEVIAEGIETVKQMEMLGGYYCDTGQGFLVSKAVQEAEFSQMTLNIQDKLIGAVDSENKGQAGEGEEKEAVSAAR